MNYNFFLKFATDKQSISISILGKPSGEAERTFKTITIMAEDLKKKPEELQEEQLDEVSGGFSKRDFKKGQHTTMPVEREIKLPH